MSTTPFASILSREQPNLRHVAFCCSGREGALQLAVAVRSLFETQADPDTVRVHILWERVELDKLQRSWAPWLRQITFYRMRDYLGEKARDPAYGHWFRTWLHAVLPAELERVLYLDYDVLVRQDLAALWQLPLQGYAAAAVFDPESRSMAPQLSKYALRLGIDYRPDDPYFNTGALFIDLRRWAELDVGATLDERFEQYRPHQENGGPNLCDQNEINMIFRQELLPLSPTWNLLEKAERYAAWDFELYAGLGEPADYFEPRVTHFAGCQKAFCRWRRASEKEAFYSVLDRTAWSGWRSDNDRSLCGRLLSQLLEFHYLFVRGYEQGCLSDYRARMLRLVCAHPWLLLAYALVPLNRWRWRLVAWRDRLFGRNDA